MYGVISNMYEKSANQMKCVNTLLIHYNCPQMFAIVKIICAYLHHEIYD